MGSRCCLAFIALLRFGYSKTRDGSAHDDRNALRRGYRFRDGGRDQRNVVEKEKVMRISKIVCDQCGKDLTYTSFTMEYRIQVTGIRMPGEEGAALCSDMRSDPIGDPKDLCSIDCLRFWAIEEYSRKKEK